jgi:hypothetical protein
MGAQSALVTKMDILRRWDVYEGHNASLWQTHKDTIEYAAQSGRESMGLLILPFQIQL